MLPDLFSQFDPRVRSLFKISYLGFWCISFLLFIPIRPSFYIGANRNKVFFSLLVSPIVRISKENNRKFIQGGNNFLVGFFFLVFFVNFSGIIP